jgi:N-acetylneuraminate synthase
MELLICIVVAKNGEIIKMNKFAKLDHTYLIGEIGINHNGDLQIAKKLIDAVFACNWDCVKFQKRNPDICVPEDQKNKIRSTPWGEIKYIEYKHKIEFGKNEYDYINQYCGTKPVDWTASVWDLESLKFITNYDVPFIKIGSAMLTNLPLLIEVAKLNIPLVVSTGMSTIEEIDKSVNEILKYGQNPIIMHTNSSYPTPKDEINLNIIPMFKERYGCIVGYSGHEEDLEPTVIAVALGARVIERHITLSHDMWGTDQKASLEVMGMDILRKRIDVIRKIMGSNQKNITVSEIEIRKKLRGN